MKKLFLLFIILVGCEAVVPAPLDEIVEVSEVSEVPVMMYHYVRDVDRSKDSLGWNLSVSPELFEEHLNVLWESGYESVGVADLADGLVEEGSVVLIFDDGTVDFYETAWPLFRQYGFGASIALVSDFIGSDGYMSREQIEELVDGGIEILGHSASHKDLRSADLQREVVESKKALEEMFGVEVVGFVYPSGKYNSGVLGAIEEAGYEAAFTVKNGMADLSGDLFQLPRFRMDNREAFKKVRF